MATTTMTLVEFLTARIDRDGIGHVPLVGKGGAVCTTCKDEYGYPVPDRHPVAWPCRPHRELEAKRAILKVAAEADAKCPENDWPDEGDMSWAPLSDVGRYNLRALAAVYSDHADYDETWRL